MPCNAEICTATEIRPATLKYALQHWNMHCNAEICPATLKYALQVQLSFRVGCCAPKLGNKRHSTSLPWRNRCGSGPTYPCCPWGSDETPIQFGTPLLWCAPEDIIQFWFHESGTGRGSIRHSVGGYSEVLQLKSCCKGTAPRYFFPIQASRKRKAFPIKQVSTHLRIAEENQSYWGPLYYSQFGQKNRVWNYIKVSVWLVFNSPEKWSMKRIK
jgi:hypothetical protein